MTRGHRRPGAAGQRSRRPPPTVTFGRRVPQRQAPMTNEPQLFTKCRWQTLTDVSGSLSSTAKSSPG